MHTQRFFPPPHRASRGIVLPMALIMLVILSFAGLMAARNSATYEQFSNNMRTSQVARQAAEDALRYCERVAMFTVDADLNADSSDTAEKALYTNDAAKLVSTVIASDGVTALQGGSWNTLGNWVKGDDKPVIEVTLSQDSNAQGSATVKNKPACIIQKLSDERFLITTRGLSNDAKLATSGALSAGSEVWLQSILAPSVPLKPATPAPAPAPGG
jgi:type IV pilus assembly protein PilX